MSFQAGKEVQYFETDSSYNIEVIYTLYVVMYTIKM